MTVPTPGVPVTLIRKNKIFSLVCEVCLLTPERKKCEDYLGFRGCGYLKYYFAWAKNIIQYYLYVFLLKMREGTPGRIEPPLARCLCTTSINIPQSPPTSASYRNVRDFGKLPWLLEKRRRRRKAVSISLLTSVAEGNFRRLRSLTGWRKCWYFFLPRLGANTCFEMSSHAFEKWGSLFGKSF